MINIEFEMLLQCYNPLTRVATHYDMLEFQDTIHVPYLP